MIKYSKYLVLQLFNKIYFTLSNFKVYKTISLNNSLLFNLNINEYEYSGEYIIFLTC